MDAEIVQHLTAMGVGGGVGGESWVKNQNITRNILMYCTAPYHTILLLHVHLSRPLQINI